MIKLVLLVIYVIIVSFSALIGGAITANETDYETNILKKAFYLQREAWRQNKDELNIVGLILLIVGITLCCWAANLLILVIMSLGYGLEKSWKLFKYIFRKKDEK